ncbi:hypothetical protein [Chryseobacterium schmidteae]|uniref:hypothetical protein n=1 Tax=Chryseobacterium schmidteae TaxID=2730404 RepID=UPI00158E9381|nr:hypothetical protein [Chryseobacterium schmidteae]
MPKSIKFNIPLCIGKPEDLGTLAKFFEVLHLKEVLVVIISHLIIHLKKINFMEIVKTVIVHLIIGIILTFLSINLMQIDGAVGIAGGLPTN